MGDMYIYRKILFFSSDFSVCSMCFSLWERWWLGLAGRLAAGGGRQAAAGHVVGAARVRQKLSQRRFGASAPASGSSSKEWDSARCAAGLASRPIHRWREAWRVAVRKRAGTSLPVLSPRRACAETLPPQPRTARPLRCPPRLACT